MKYDVITIGSATQDVFLTADEFRVIKGKGFHTDKGLCLPFGSKVTIEKLAFASGGGGTNAAVTFARQGFKTACLGIVGADSGSSDILDELRREGVNAKYFQQHDGGRTAYSVILVAPDGERTILSYKGEGMRWQPERIPWDQLQANWAYVNSLGGHDDMLQAIVAWARKYKVHLATNPGGQELELGLDRLAEHWKYFDIVGMNQEEAARLVGLPYDNEEEIFRTLDRAIGGIFIMTKGTEGSVVSDGHHLYRAAVPESKVVERTGAGDAFHSGFLAEFIRSGSIEKAVQFGTANASSVVMQYGAKAGILHRGDNGRWPLVQVERRSL